jgi:hypothetical protein
MSRPKEDHFSCIQGLTQDQMTLPSGLYPSDYAIQFTVEQYSKDIAFFIA